MNILCGARLTDQGLIQESPTTCCATAGNLDADAIRILADVNVKHSAPLAESALRRRGRRPARTAAGPTP